MQDFYAEARKLHKNNRKKEALTLYQRGIREADEKCWYGYAILLKESPLPTKKKEGERILSEHYPTIKQLADSGDTAAATIIAFCLWNGFIHDDAAKAIDYFSKGADLQDTESTFYCGYLYATGDGVSRDLNKALLYFRRAALLGSEEGQQYHKDLLSWMHEQAQSGDFAILNNLGVHYYEGDAVEKNLHKE